MANTLEYNSVVATLRSCGLSVWTRGISKLSAQDRSLFFKTKQNEFEVSSEVTIPIPTQFYSPSDVRVRLQEEGLLTPEMSDNISVKDAANAPSAALDR